MLTNSIMTGRGLIALRGAICFLALAMCAPGFAKEDLMRTVCRMSADTAAEAMRARLKGVPEEEFISDMVHGYYKDLDSMWLKVAIGWARKSYEIAPLDPNKHGRNVENYCLGYQGN